ncbi:hypothetical protein, conserved [Babesia ovata]|uniref:Uncharacterized protein n=1 Tax=Babesia ovata TaxID=189622 RepID=A0A2H6K6Q5_9APIC|nr:uncharacterized protein BOVATA_001550 [Babesia ovata]GBE58662.1 hypothetical protein, conserved [Babesia ovata]
MKDAAGYPANGFHRAQRRGPYGSSELLNESTKQEDFNPISSSREMRKIMYYEHMFSKLDSQDKSKKGSSNSAHSSSGSSLEHRNRDEGDVSTSTKSTSKGSKSGSSKKPTTQPAAAAADHGHGMYTPQRTERAEKTTKAEDGGSVSHQIPLEQPVKQQATIAKREAISIKIKTQAYRGPGAHRSPISESGSKQEFGRKMSGSSESSGSMSRSPLYGREDGSSQSLSPSINSMTDIAGTKISRLLGIDQIANSSTGLSASQRQWLVPTFDLRQSVVKDTDRKSHSTGFDSETRATSSVESSTDGESSKKGSGEPLITNGSSISRRDSSDIKIPRMSYHSETYATQAKLSDESRLLRVSRFSAPLVQVNSHVAEDAKISRAKSELTKDILPSVGAELKRDSFEAAVPGGLDFSLTPVYRHREYRLPSAFQIKAVIPSDTVSERSGAQSPTAVSPSSSNVDKSVTAGPVKAERQRENAAGKGKSRESPKVVKEVSPKVKQEPAYQHVQQDYQLGAGQMDIILNEEDMEIDAVVKDVVMDDEPVSKGNGDEGYVPEDPLPVVEDTSNKKTTTKKKTKKRKAPTPAATPAASTPLSDAAPASEAVTPESAVAEDVYPEPPPVPKATRTRTSTRTTVKRKKGAAAAQVQEPDPQPQPQPVAKTPRGGARSSSRAASGGSRRNASEPAGSKSQRHAGGESGGSGAAERSQKSAYAVSRIVSVAEAEKIMELYRQHNTDLERLKRLLLDGDLAGFGRVIAEQADAGPPERRCLLHPRLIVARPSDPVPVPPREQPPQNPVELSLKYRLLSRLMNK